MMQIRILVLSLFVSVYIHTSKATAQNGIKLSEVLRVAIPNKQSSSWPLPSVYLRNVMDTYFPEYKEISYSYSTQTANDDKVSSDDSIEPIQAGAINRIATPVNPVTPCTPIPGKTALVIGQDLYSITNYTAAFTGHPTPVAFMGYTALENEWGELTGLKRAIDYGSGLQWVDGIIKQFPSSSIQLGLWLVGQCEDIVMGILDHNIQRLAKYMKDHGKHHAFYLRIGYEFDSSGNHYDAGFYRVAYQRIVNIFREVNATNVAFVWHASGFGARDHMHISDWYPGARYVDWCGISLFQQPYACSGDTVYCSVRTVEEVLDFCKAHSLPVMIAESTPYGGIVDEHTMMHNPEAHNEAGVIGDTWSRWFAPVLSIIERHDIRMWSYINCEWDLQRMWQKNHAKGELWGDTRIEKYAGVRRKWLEYVLHAPRFQMFTVPLAPLSTSGPSLAPTILDMDSESTDNNSIGSKKKDKNLSLSSLSRYLRSIPGVPTSVSSMLSASSAALSTSISLWSNNDVHATAASVRNNYQGTIEDTDIMDTPSSSPSSSPVQPSVSPSAAPSAAPSLSLKPSMAPSVYPTVPNYAPLGRLHADMCSPPRTQVLLAKHPDFTDDEYGERSQNNNNNNPNDKNHTHSNLPPGSSSIPHHRRDFYNQDETVILRNILEIIVFFLEILEVFLAISFCIAVLVLILSCMYKYCSRSIEYQRDQHILQHHEQRKSMTNAQGTNLVAYQAINQQEEEEESHDDHNSGKKKKHSTIAMVNIPPIHNSGNNSSNSASQRAVDRKGYSIIE